MITIPKNLSGPELLAFIAKHKSELINQKGAFPIHSDSYDYPYTYSRLKKRTPVIGKAAGEQMVIVDDNGTKQVTAIANAANWVDYQMDMLLPDCWKKTIKESGPAGKNRIYHLKNHKQDTDGVVGKITDLYSQDYALTDLGINMAGATQCLVMESTAMEALSDKTFDLYANNIINQHSIGMQYVKLDLAINDPNYPVEFGIWNKYFAQVINKDVVSKSGYFWVVYEIKLLEVSAVLWGANELTPTMDVEDMLEDTEEDDYQTGKGNKPPKGTGHKKEEPGSSTLSVSEMIAKTKINF